MVLYDTEKGFLSLFAGWSSEIRTRLGNGCSVGTVIAVRLLSFLRQTFLFWFCRCFIVMASQERKLRGDTSGREGANKRAFVTMNEGQPQKAVWTGVSSSMRCLEDMPVLGR